MGLVVVHQPISILAHLKEVGFFFHQLNFVARWRFPTDHVALVVTVYFGQLAFGEVFFIINGIPTAVLTLVDVTLVQELLENLLDRFFVVIIGRPDELVVGNLQLLP